MASGLKLSGLKGQDILTADLRNAVDVTSQGGAFTVGSLSAIRNLQGSAAASSGGASISGVFNSNPAQNTASLSFHNISGPPGNVAQSDFSFNYKLLGWNSDGLLLHDNTTNADALLVDPNSALGQEIAAGTLPLHDTPANLPAFTQDPTDAPFNLSALCFAAGTSIATPSGGVAVEDLKIGDQVLTGSGAVRPVIWLGNMTLRPARHPRPHEASPVRIRAGAFGDGLPMRDLRVSPGHALYVDGVLILAASLVNGATIIQDEVESVRYFHVELESHDVLLAEGLPCESYLDDGNRSSFANSGQATELYGRLDPKSWDEACAPWVDAGSQLDAVRNRLHARAEAMGFEVSQDPDLHLIVDDMRIEPFHRSGDRFWFPVSACRSVQLCSRADVLKHVVPGTSDGRRLGVALSDLRINGMAVNLSDVEIYGAGFHEVETLGDGHWRWTDGAATLRLALDTPALIEVGLRMVAPAWKRRGPALRIVRAVN
jgi:hypothetical protein